MWGISKRIFTLNFILSLSLPVCVCLCLCVSSFCVLSVGGVDFLSNLVTLYSLSCKWYFSHLPCFEDLCTLVHIDHRDHMDHTGPFLVCSAQSESPVVYLFQFWCVSPLLPVTHTAALNESVLSHRTHAMLISKADTGAGTCWATECTPSSAEILQWSSYGNLHSSTE